MWPMMMFGLIALGKVLIPMGFLFLSVLGGKALLLAKLSLILSAIQGLKKIATSSYNYGLYQVPQPNPCKYLKLIKLYKQYFEPFEYYLLSILIH